MQYAMELMRMSDDELISELERKMYLRYTSNNVGIKMMCNNNIKHIENEIRRRMK